LPRLGSMVRIPSPAPVATADDALKLFVSNKAGEAGTDLQPSHRAEMFQDRETDRREPDLRPRKGRHHEKGEEFPAKNLIANRLVEKGPRGKTYGPPLALIENALGFEEQSLAETLRADDDEFVIAIRAQKAFDFRGAVEQGLVEVLRHLDVVRIHGPRTHAVPPMAGTRLAEAVVGEQ
jgi:hypothetical protein